MMQSHSKHSMVSLDPVEYYQHYNEKTEQFDIENQIVAECYLSFTQLLQSEFKQKEKRDSSML